jgi:hypothetical protein
MLLTLVLRSRLRPLPLAPLPSPPLQKLVFKDNTAKPRILNAKIYDAHCYQIIIRLSNHKKLQKKVKRHTDEKILAPKC